MIRVEIESQCAGTAEPAILAEPTFGLWRWSGAVVLDNCETDARTQFDSTLTQRPSGVGIPNRDPNPLTSSYLVDPASSHMLVLKIKPCMSKYKHLYRETANGSLKQLWFI